MRAYHKLRVSIRIRHDPLHESTNANIKVYCVRCQEWYRWDVPIQGFESCKMDQRHAATSGVLYTGEGVLVWSKCRRCSFSQRWQFTTLQFDDNCDGVSQVNGHQSKSVVETTERADTMGLTG
jgi:hypothetical protein